MKTGATVSVHATFELTPRQLAEAFCQLDDESQVDFLEQVGRVAETWGPGCSIMQWHFIGRRLRSAPEIARSVVQEIAGAMNE